jgi:hypothetical protein
MPPGQLPKSLASSSLFDASPHTLIRSPRLRLGKFVISNAKRLFRQYRPKTEVSGLARQVRFTPRSRHRQPAPACPFGANSGSRVCFVWVATDHQLSDKRKPDPERRAAVIPIIRPYQPMVRLDNRARDGQPHPHPSRLAGKKRFEDLF